MARKNNRLSSNKEFSKNTVTLDGSRVKDNVQWRVVKRQKSHDAIMRKVKEHQAKIL